MVDSQTQSSHNPDHDGDAILAKIPPPSCGCKSDIVSQLAERGVETMLAGNIGAGAVSVLGMHGIKVARGFS